MWNFIRWWFLVGLLLLVTPFAPYGMLMLAGGISVIGIVIILLAVVYIWKGTAGTSRYVR